MRIKILTDSCCDLPIHYLDDHRDMLSFVGMPITVGERHFRDDLGRDESLEQFYTELSSGINASTAQITPNDFYELFKKTIDEGDALIYLGLSSGISGTYNNALMAKKILEDEGIQDGIHVINGFSASIGLGLMIMETIDKIKAGEDLDAILNWIESYKFHFHHWFVVDDLHYLKRGGRIPPALALVGSALNVKPILTVDEVGKLIKHTNVRGRKKAMKYLAEKVTESSFEKGRIVIGHGNCYEDALLLKDRIRDSHKNADIIISNLSATIACHVGPKMLAVGFLAGSRL